MSHEMSINWHLTKYTMILFQDSPDAIDPINRISCRKSAQHKAITFYLHSNPPEIYFRGIVYKSKHIWFNGRVRKEIRYNIKYIIASILLWLQRTISIVPFSNCMFYYWAITKFQYGISISSRVSWISSWNLVGTQTMSDEDNEEADDHDVHRNVERWHGSILEWVTSRDECAASCPYGFVSHRGFYSLWLETSWTWYNRFWLWLVFAMVSSSGTGMVAFLLLLHWGGLAHRHDCLRLSMARRESLWRAKLFCAHCKYYNILLECCATLYSNTSLFLVLASEEGSKWPSHVWMTGSSRNFKVFVKLVSLGSEFDVSAHASTSHFWSTPRF